MAGFYLPSTRKLVIVLFGGRTGLVKSHMGCKPNRLARSSQSTEPNTCFHWTLTSLARACLGSKRLTYFNCLHGIRIDGLIYLAHSSLILYVVRCLLRQSLMNSLKSISCQGKKFG